MRWTTDTLLFGILLVTLHISSRLPADDSSQPLLAIGGILGGIAYLGTLLKGASGLLSNGE